MKKVLSTELSKWWVLWIFFFSISVIFSLVVQFGLPLLLPQAHLGHGLFVFDSGGFHQIAVDKASAITKNGWEVWELRPRAQYPAGIASIFYVLFTAEPYTIIPLNAALHASAGCLIYYLFGLIFSSTVPAAAGAALFVLNPASLEWVSQIHRDGTFILGTLLVLTGWIMLFRIPGRKGYVWLLSPPVAVLTGSLLIWASRPYWIQVTILNTLFLFLLIVGVWIYRHARQKTILLQCTVAVLTGILMLLIPLPFKGSIEHGNFDSSYQNINESEELFVKSVNGAEVKSYMNWHRTGWPRIIEDQLYKVWCFRYITQRAGGKTVIDPEVRLNSVWEFMLYLPRALQIGLFSPFPSMWWGQGSTAFNTMARSILGLVTIFFYGCLFFLARLLWVKRGCSELWIVMLYSLIGLLVFTYTYGNIGVLVRLRYGFYMSLVGCGFAYAIQMLVFRFSGYRKF